MTPPVEPAVRDAGGTVQAPPAPTRGASAPGSPRSRVHWPAVGAFTTIACGLAWVVEAPVWSGGGLSDPRFQTLALTMMATPAIAAVLVTLLLLRPEHPARFLGLAPARPVGRLVAFLVLALLAPPLLAALAAVVGGAAGVVTLGTSPARLAALVLLPLQSLLVAVAAFGEELGWRGFLLPALRPLGTWPALLVTGVVWGLWHAPLILLGYDYGQPNAAGLALMVGFTVLVGVLLGWLRMRSASVWPCAVAHGAINASAGIVLMTLTTGPQALGANLLGWAGWVVLAAVIVLVAALRGFRWTEPSPVRSRAHRAGASSR